MFQNSNNSQRERQSINRCDLQDVSSPPPWIKDLIGTKREKLVDIVNSANSCGDQSFSEKLETFPNSYVKHSLTSSEQNISYISSKSGSTSIGSTESTDTHTTRSTCISPSNAFAQALNECQSCHSCLSSLREVPSLCDRQSGFDIKTETKAKAVHLNSAASRVYVPIVRSVSSSVITGRAFSGCGSHCRHCLALSTCVDCCLEHLKSLSICDLTPNDSSIDKNKRLRNSNTSEHKSCNSRVSDWSEEPITAGLVAQRKFEILCKQVSESSFFAHSCHICSKTDAPNNENFWNNLVKDKMICEKNRDKSDYNSHHYEEIMDCNGTPFINTCEKHSKLTNGLDTTERDDEYELKYGPGIVEKLKLKYMSISIGQQSNYKLKRSSSLENILVDSRHNHRQQCLPSNQCPNKGKPSHLLPLLGRNGALNVKSITVDAGKRTNGSQVSHRLYIQHHNNKNLFNSKSSAIVPLIKRAKSMETLLLQDENNQRERERERDNIKGKGRQPVNCTSNNSLSKRETPLSNQNDLQLNDSVLICDNSSHKSQNSANSALTQSQSNSEMKSVSHMNGCAVGVDDELPKPDTVKTYKRIFEPTGAKNGLENGKTGANVSNKSKNNYKKSQMNGSPTTTANIKRKPPVLRATNKSVALKTQPTVNSSPAIKSQSPLPQVIETIPSPSVRTTSLPAVVGQNERNNNCSDLNKSANTCNTSNTSNTSNSSIRKPPIAPKRASLTLKANPLTGMSAAINKSSKTNGAISNNSNTNASKRVEKIQNNYNSSIPTEKSLKTKANDSHKPVVPQTMNANKESSDVCPNTQINGKTETQEISENPTNRSKVIKPIANIKPFTQINQMNGKSKTETIVNDLEREVEEHNNLGHNKTNDSLVANNSVTQLEEEVIQNNELIIKANNNKSNKTDNESNGNVLESPLISNLSRNAKANKESNDERSAVKVNEVNDENVSPNTCDIVVDKSRANDNCIEEQSMHSQQSTDVLKSSLLLNSEANRPTKTATSSLWSPQNKKTNGSSTTTIVFDFRGKDVKTNLAIHPLPFGVTPPKRSLTNGSSNDSDDENYSGSTDIPLPSGIIFLGENVRVGRGALLLTRNKKVSSMENLITFVFITFFYYFFFVEIF